MSVEKQARKALRRVVFWRLVGELWLLPQAILNMITSFCRVLSVWFKSVEMALFFFELDAARKYWLLTGMELGSASGAPGRYMMAIHPDVAIERQREAAEDSYPPQLGDDEE